MNNMGVSVLCAAYNQEKYIRKTLEGFVMQKTTFPVEFLVHDDASTDSTAEIIREYAEKYPDRIIPYLEEENQYSKGNNFLFTQLLPASKGKYLAICEGDDFWTDPEKMQRQYSAMEKHPECSICVHQVQGLNEDESKKIRTFPEKPEKTGLVNTERLLHRMLSKGEWVYHTTSYFIRSEIVKNAIAEKNEFFLNALYPDHGLMLLSAYAGKFYYINRCMSVYRMEADGSVTRNNISRREDVSRRKARTLRGQKSLTAFDAATEYRYHKDVQEFLNYMSFTLSACEGDYKKLLSKDMRKYFKRLPKRMKFRVIVSRYIPVFDRLYYWVREKVKGI